MEGHEARWAEVKLNYAGADISRDIAPFLVSFTWTDNASDKADDLSVTLEDREGRWRSPWFPSKGDTITASIMTHEWEAEHRTQSLPCGIFEVDQIECSGPPTQVTIKAVSTLVSKPMRQERHTQSWEPTSLSGIAGTIASRNGLELFWDSKSNPSFERRDQIEMTDLEYLTGLCHHYGVAVKVTEAQLVCYDEEEYEKKGPVGTLKFGDKKVIQYRFSTKTNSVYKAARLQYHDPWKDETFIGTASDDVEGTGRVLELNERAESGGDAQHIAAKKLHDANKKEITGNVTLMGDLRFLGGSNVALSGWGNFDGKYVIEKATHSISGSYTTTLDLHMCDESKPKKKGKKASKAAASTPSLVYTGTDVYRR